MVSSQVAAEWTYHPTVVTNRAEELSPGERSLTAMLDEVTALLLRLRGQVAGIVVEDYRSAVTRRSILQQIDGVQMAAENTKRRRLGIQGTGPR
jgi:hypothetical protein